MMTSELQHIFRRYQRVRVFVWLYSKDGSSKVLIFIIIILLSDRLASFKFVKVPMIYILYSQLYSKVMGDAAGTLDLYISYLHLCRVLVLLDTIAVKK